MKRIVKWTAALLLTPVLLVLALAALLYCPPVQNWAVRQVAGIVADETGMSISVGHVCLAWPLDLSIERFIMVHEGDTIADVDRLVADVQLRPLLNRRIVVNGIELGKARINTNGFISDLRVQGYIGQLKARSRGIDLRGQTVEVNGALLSDAQIDIALSDTAAADTTKSEMRWVVKADSVSISRTALSLHLPEDTTTLEAYVGHAVARETDIDLGEGVYRVSAFDYDDGQLSYHPLSLTGIALGIDSISYTPQGTRLSFRRAALRDKSGLEFTSLTGGIALDSTFSAIQLKALKLSTTDSDIDADADVDFSVMDSISPGRMKLRLNAQVGKQDIMRIAAIAGEGRGEPLLPEQFVKHYPNHPLSVRGSVNGNLENMELTGIRVSLPTAFHASADGFVADVRDKKKLRAQVAFNVKTQNTAFLTALLPADIRSNYALPDGIALQGNVSAGNQLYRADITARESSGEVKLKGSYSASSGDYSADGYVSGVNLHHFMPHDSLYTLSAKVRMKGRGTDMLNAGTALDADVVLDRLQYGSLALDSVTMRATLKGGQAQIELNSDNVLLGCTLSASGLLTKRKIDATLSGSIAHIDLQRLRLSEKPLTVGMKGKVELLSNLGDIHQVRGLIDDIYIKDRLNDYRPKAVGLFLRTAPDTTLVRLQSGTLIVKADASGGYRKLMRQAEVLVDTIVMLDKKKVIDQALVMRLLPQAHLYVSSGHTNPLADVLRTKGIAFRQLLVDLYTSPVTGLNGDAYLHSLNYDSLLIDTIAIQLKHKGQRFTYNGHIANNNRNPQFVFKTLFDGHLHEHGALIGVRYFDKRNRMGVRLGATAEMEDSGIRLRLLPERPTIGYKEFNLNKDNYIFLPTKGPVEAKIDLIADDKTGVKIYTMEQTADDATTNLLDLTVSLNSFSLDEFTSVLPYVPRMSGQLGGDFHIVQNEQGRFSVVSDLAVSKMAYESAPIGNISAELNYLQREDASQAVEALLMLDGNEFSHFSGSLLPPASPSAAMGIDGTLSLMRAPLSLVNGFVPDQIVGLDGYGEGTITVKGTTARPLVDGEVYLDSAYLVSTPYGISLRFDNDPVRIADSHLLLENFGLYAYNDQPLVLMGDIDFSRPENTTVDMRMRASNYQVIKAKQTQKSLAFGNAFVNFFARLTGPVGNLHMRGRLDVLGSTDLTYMLLDSPLSTDNRLDELVKFTDFSDSTQTVVVRPTPSGIDADLTVNVSQGARILCNLNAEQTNYVDLQGGGELRMQYKDNGLSLRGRYTLTNGQMKYSVPIIPLKTFTIKDGSYVEFTGDPANPRLNITATERIKSTVASSEGGATRSVAFDCGVVITQTLNNMGLQFIISAPEDMSVSGELQSMSAEERGKLAVTMLTTGMYLADGSSSFSMNNALNSFLQGEINQITGNALKTVDLQVGVDNSTDASGTVHTDYSFQFAKRLWNNRVKLEVGGKVSTGSDDLSGQQQSFFDNVSMEYRLDQSGQKNIKAYYKQNVYDWLEGYTGEYGVGFIWRRKLNSFLEIFKKSKQQPMPVSQPLPKQ